MTEFVKYLFDDEYLKSKHPSMMRKFEINESMISMLVKILFKIGKSKGLI